MVKLSALACRLGIGAIALVHLSVPAPMGATQLDRIGQRSAARVVIGLNPISYADGVIDTHPPRRDLARMRELGASAVRLGAYWNEIEPAPGDFRWGPLDAVIAESLNVALDPWVVIIDAPDDQCSIGRGRHSNPKDQNACPPILGQRYARFLTEFATRYRGKVTYVCIGNEPEHADYFSSKDPKEYARVLSFSYAAIKAVNPAMQVGMAATGPTNLPFLADVIDDLNGKVAFDFVEDHPYRSGSPLDKEELYLADGDTINATLKEQLDHLRRLFVGRRFAPPRVALTEFGWGAYDDRGDDSSAVPLRKQADYLCQTYKLLREEPALDFVFAAFWFSDRDWAEAAKNPRTKDEIQWQKDAADSFGFHGLMWPDGGWKPAAHAFRALSAGRLCEPGSVSLRSRWPVGDR